MDEKKTKKNRLELRLTDEETAMIEQIQEKTGMNKTRILVLGIKKLHKMLYGDECFVRTKQ